MRKRTLTSEQLRAARALLRWEQRDLSRESGLSLATVRRLESKPGPIVAYDRTIATLFETFERAGVKFLDSNGEGAGLRFIRGEGESHYG